MAEGYGSYFAFWIGGVGFTETVAEDTTEHQRVFVEGLKVRTCTATFTVEQR